MRESFLLLVISTGVALFLYGIGMPLAWVIGLGVAALFVDLLFIRATKSSPSEQSLCDYDQDTHPQPMSVPQKIDESGSDKRLVSDAQVPMLAISSVQRSAGLAISLPAKPAEDRSFTHDEETTWIQAEPATQSPHARESHEDKFRLSDTLNAPMAPTLPAAPAQEIRLAESTKTSNPLEKYQTEQFAPGRYSAPIEVLPPTPSMQAVMSPLGPDTVSPTVKHQRSETQRAIRSSRPARVVLKPEDFQRNTGLPGYLYLARNPEHWAGLFKVGQTVRRNPSKRIDELNKIHATHKDIGCFKLLEVVEVIDAYGAEQVMFQVLADLRPVAGREFFVADQDFLSRTMRAVGDFVRGLPDELNLIYRDLDPTKFPAWPGHVARHNYRGVGRVHGWVYLARNQYHLANTYLFGVTAGSPDVVVRELNEGQRHNTPQIGFFTVVFAFPVSNTRASRSIGWKALSPWKLRGSRSYVRGPIEELCVALTSDLLAAAN